MKISLRFGIFPVHAMQAYSGGGFITPLILNLGTTLHFPPSIMTNRIGLLNVLGGGE
jgi:hypothetical protein